MGVQLAVDVRVREPEALCEREGETVSVTVLVGDSVGEKEALLILEEE